MGETDSAGMYHMLGEIAKDVRGLVKIVNDQTLVLNEHTRALNEHSEAFREVFRVLADHTRRFESLEESVGELRASVQGHGIPLCELEDRTRRIERHLSLPPAAE